MKPVSIAVVIATNRPAAFLEWFEAWKVHLSDSRVGVFVIEDSPEHFPELEFTDHIKNWRGHLPARYAWKDIDRELGASSWTIPRRSSAIKSFGFMKAYHLGYDYIWTLDDDCFPDQGFDVEYVDEMIDHIERDEGNDDWYNTIDGTGLYPRGYPYGIRQIRQPVMIHHGMWSNIPDLDGITALEYPNFRTAPYTSIERVPTGKFFAMCGMNLVFRREMTPAMYFGLQGRVRDPAFDGRIGPEPATNPLPFDRFDDIWAGLFAKKVADHMGWAVTSGGPSIKHTKLSDPTMRVIKEGPGIAINELLWKHVAEASLSGCDSVRSCFLRLSAHVHLFADVDSDRHRYWTKLAEAMRIWAELFNE